MEARALKERLADWQDFDIAEYELGTVLGIFSELSSPPPAGPHDNFHNFKGVLWANTPLGNCLYSMIERLVVAGMLLKDEEECRFKWNPEFKVV